MKPESSQTTSDVDRVGSTGGSTPGVQVRINGGRIEQPVCCETLARAFSMGTDNDNYGALARVWNNTPASIYVGCDLPALRFCPWCGTEMQKLSWSNGTDQPRG